MVPLCCLVLKEVLGFVSSFFEILPNGTKQALHHLGIVSLKASQIPCSGAGEMAQPFRALVLLEDIGLSPSTLMVARSCLQL